MPENSIPELHWTDCDGRLHGKIGMIIVFIIQDDQLFTTDILGPRNKLFSLLPGIKHNIGNFHTIQAAKNRAKILLDEWAHQAGFI